MKHPDIKNLPPELQELCHIRQKEQGNDGTFDGPLDRGKERDNFIWERTKEGQKFWNDIWNGRLEEIKLHPLYPQKQNYDIY